MEILKALDVWPMTGLVRGSDNTTPYKPGFDHRVLLMKSFRRRMFRLEERGFWGKENSKKGKDGQVCSQAFLQNMARALDDSTLATDGTIVNLMRRFRQLIPGSGCMELPAGCKLGMSGGNVINRKNQKVHASAKKKCRTIKFR